MTIDKNKVYDETRLRDMPKLISDTKIEIYKSRAFLDSFYIIIREFLVKMCAELNQIKEALPFNLQTNHFTKELIAIISSYNVMYIAERKNSKTDSELDVDISNKHLLQTMGGSKKKATMNPNFLTIKT